MGAPPGAGGRPRRGGSETRWYGARVTLCSEPVRRAFEHAVAVYGDLGVELVAFARGLDERAAGVLHHADDLYLVLGCAAGSESAIRVFCREHLREIDAAVRKIDADPGFVDEARQRALTHLLVAGGRPPRIGSYGARGPLGAWTRVAATRVALNLRRQLERQPTVAASVRELLNGPSEDPDLDLLRRRFGPELQEGMLRGLQSLQPRDRTVLRLYAFEGLNIDAIGALYDVHRATVARWIARARESVFAAARSHFREALGVGTVSFEGLCNVLVSQLELRVSQFHDP